MQPILIRKENMDNDIDILLKINGLTISFEINDKELIAVNDLNLQIKKGQILALVGESGCGKSVTALSLLKLISRPGKIAKGQIWFYPNNNKPIAVNELSDRDPRLYELRGGDIGMIFQEPMTALSPVHTIGNQIGEALKLHKRVNNKTACREVVKILHQAGIANPKKVAKLYPHEISGGMRQRAVIAMALIAEPKLLIADEPTTALDVTIQAQILNLIKQLRQTMGISVLLITHDLGVVAQVADYVAVMYLGRIVESAPVRQLIKFPSHPYTMALLKSIPGLNPKNKKLASIKGSVPSISDIPLGCSFHPRCEYSQKNRCDKGDHPILKQISDGQYTACIRAGEIQNNG